MQIVLSGNRVIAHGEDCFLAMGGTVICEETGKAYPNATIAEVDAIPADVDSVGYEYRAGVFVPCAPYGKTNSGRVMLACDECGAPRSSDLTSENGGLHIPGVLSGAKMPAEVLSLLGMTDGNLADALGALLNKALAADAKCVTGQYTGTGTSSASITFTAPPKLVVILQGTYSEAEKNNSYSRWVPFTILINGCTVAPGFSPAGSTSEGSTWSNHYAALTYFSASWSGNKVTVGGFNTSAVVFKYFAICL